MLQIISANADESFQWKSWVSSKPNFHDRRQSIHSCFNLHSTCTVLLPLVRQRSPASFSSNSHPLRSEQAILLLYFASILFSEALQKVPNQQYKARREIKVDGKEVRVIWYLKHMKTQVRSSLHRTETKNVQWPHSRVNLQEQACHQQD